MARAWKTIIDSGTSTASEQIRAMGMTFIQVLFE
jgi:hypothetical protein